MSGAGFDPGLADALRAGVFYATPDDLDTLSALAHDAGLLVRRVDLAHIPDRPTLLLRIAVALDAPITAWRNWEALVDNLRSLAWLQAPGYVLLFDGAGEMHAGNEADFDSLVAVLDQAQAHWRARGVPFWAFLALRDADFDLLQK